MGAWRNSTETQQLGHAPRSGSEVKNGRLSSAKDGAPERLRCGTIQEEVSQILQRPGGSESDPAEGVRRRCKKNSPSVLSYVGKRTRECCDRGSEYINICHFCA